MKSQKTLHTIPVKVLPPLKAGHDASLRETARKASLTWDGGVWLDPGPEPHGGTRMNPEKPAGAGTKMNP